MDRPTTPQFLNQIGFKATQKVIADATYFPTIGNLKLNPQTGFADWNQDFPNPIDFYLLVDGHAIQPTNNQNFGQVNDPHINSESGQARRGPDRASSPRSPASGRRSTSTRPRRRTSRVFGYQTFPKFTRTGSTLERGDLPARCTGGTGPRLQLK